MTDETKDIVQVPAYNRNGGYVYPDTSPKALPRLHRGITRRNWLSGLAMQGLLTALGSGIESFHKDKLVLLSYDIADAMIAEGRK